MAQIEYIAHRFKKKALRLVTLAEEIAASYAARGMSLTLRQLYYRLVAKGHIPNNMKSYKTLVKTLTDARLGGHFDWDYLTDRTRYLRSLGHYDNPAEIVEGTADAFQLDLWEGQKQRVEVWVEKDALIGIVEGIASSLDVACFSCRGYTSASEMHEAALRLARYRKKGLEPIILHLGDHDPSGLDMTRDIEARLSLFCNYHGYEQPEMRRLALNFDQIRKYKPPPNPVKTTDSRCDPYIREFGNDSWELDALEPEVIEELIEKNIKKYIDKKTMQARKDLQERGRDDISYLAEHFEHLCEKRRREEE